LIISAEITVHKSSGCSLVLVPYGVTSFSATLTHQVASVLQAVLPALPAYFSMTGVSACCVKCSI